MAVFGAPVTDAGLKELRELKGLRSLSLWHTQRTDVGLKELRGLTALQSLNIKKASVTDTQMKNLHAARFGENDLLVAPKHGRLQ